MGYTFDVNESKFKVLAANIKKMRKVLLKSKDSIKLLQGIADDTDLDEIMEELRWPVETNDDGDITSIEFSGEKLWDDVKLFRLIAEFVEDGSYIECSGEEGTLWRWVFVGGKFAEKYPKISWD